MHREHTKNSTTKAQLYGYAQEALRVWGGALFRVAEASWPCPRKPFDPPAVSDVLPPPPPPSPPHAPPRRRGAPPPRRRPRPPPKQPPKLGAIAAVGAKAQADKAKMAQMVAEVNSRAANIRGT